MDFIELHNVHDGSLIHVSALGVLAIKIESNAEGDPVTVVLCNYGLSLNVTETPDEVLSKLVANGTRH